MADDDGVDDDCVGCGVVAFVVAIVADGAPDVAIVVVAAETAAVGDGWPSRDWFGTAGGGVVIVDSVATGCHLRHWRRRRRRR